MPTQQTPRSSNVTQIVSIFLGVTRQHQKALMDPLKLSEGQVSRKMKKGLWSVDDLDVLAEFFGVTIATFFEDPEEIRRRMLGSSPLRWITTPNPDQISLDELLTPIAA